MRSLACAVLPLVCAAACGAQEPATAASAAARSLETDLAAAVDLPDEKGRREAADALARRAGIALAQWQQTCARFGAFGALEPGPNEHRVELPVLGGREETDVYLYVPKGYDQRHPAPLLLWGHGAGGTGAREHLPWQELAERLGLLILAPTAAGREQGYSFTARQRAAQLAALRWARRQANVDENAVFVGGASRGGHLTWDLALRFPDLWAGALPCIGGPRLLPGEQDNLRYLENVARLPLRDLQGSKDDPLLLQNLRLCFQRLQRLGAKDCQLIEFAEAGHDFDLAAVDWAQFFTARRQPLPERVVRLAARPGEARAAWIEILAVERPVAESFTPRVDAATWNGLDEAGRRALLLDQMIEHTARLEVRRLGGGRFAAEGRGVRRFRLLLTADMLGKDGAVEVEWAGRTIRRKVAPSAGVLLREFVERFDRTFLPVAEVTVP